MAPIKFEESIKETLEKRTIVPSEDSWEKLSKRLGDADKKRRGSTVLWLSIAASLIVLFGLTIFLFQDDKEEEITNRMVNTETNVQELDEEKNIHDLQSSENNLTDTNSVADKKENSKVNTVAKVKSNQQIKKSASKVPTQSAIANNIDKDKQSANYNDSKANSEINNTDVVVDVSQTAQAVKLSSEAETDSLLKRAQRSIIKGSDTKDEIITVNASSLLQEVEGEIEESFRTKMFETLMDGIEVVKTSVAQRNN